MNEYLSHTPSTAAGTRPVRNAAPARILHGGRWRRGSIFVEVMMAMAIASAVLVGVAQTLALTSQQRRTAEYRALATYEAGNLMEDLMTRPWGELTKSELHEVPLTELGRQRLPGGRLQLGVAAEGESDSVRRLTIRVDWEVATNRRGLPVQLVAWRHQQPQEPAP